ncbi:hypothetical protein [Bosea sp. (in: a-proteobacteria)]|uniref:hypothetical protein n=1 Tax=Bosea sp. (in: a-proteobacteria) TaxID=1871050 RepID=UPI003B3B14BA
MPSRAYTFDLLYVLKDDGAVTASAAAQVGGSNKILDLGGGLMEATIVLNIAAIDVSSGDERYLILAQGSNSPTFANTVETLAAVDLGAAGGRAGGGGLQSSPTGQRFLGIATEVGDTVYRYLRLYHVISGTTPSINYTAFLANPPGR